MGAAAIQRTAKADFRVGDEGLAIDGEPVGRGYMIKAGQVIDVPTKARLKKLVAAGVVAEGDDDDADVPKIPKPKPPVAPELVAKAQEKRTAAATARDAAVKAQADFDALKARPGAEAAAIAAAETAAKEASDKATAAETEATEAEAAAA